MKIKLTSRENVSATAITKKVKKLNEPNLYSLDLVATALLASQKMGGEENDPDKR